MQILRTSFNLFLYTVLMAIAIHFYLIFNLPLKTGIIITTVAIIIEFILTYLSNTNMVAKTVNWIFSPLTFGVLFAVLFQFTNSIFAAFLLTLLMLIADYNLNAIEYVMLMFTTFDLDLLKNTKQQLKENDVDCKIVKKTMHINGCKVKGYALLVNFENSGFLHDFTIPK